MMRMNLDGFVGSYFKSWSQLLSLKKKEEATGWRIENLSSLPNLLPESQEELLEKLKPLYTALWNNYLKEEDADLKKDKNAAEKDQKELQVRLSLVEDKLSLIHARSAEELLYPPLTFMELAQKFSQTPKHEWRKLFLSYYYTGVYDLILANNPTFKLQFTLSEKHTNEDTRNLETIRYLYNYGQKNCNFDIDNEAKDAENLQDKAIIFLREIYYIKKRLARPEFESYSGMLFGHSRTTKCSGGEQILEMILLDEKLEDFFSLIEKSEMSLNELYSLFAGEAGVALAPLSIHMAVTGRCPSEILIKLGVERSSSFFSYLGLGK